MNIFEQALETLKETMAQHTDVNVIYRHNGVDYPIQATRGNINWATLNRIGDVALGENFREYIIQSNLLPFIPSNGDTLVDNNEVFEVYSPDSNSKCWRYSDPYKGLMRVYTRRLKQ